MKYINQLCFIIALSTFSFSQENPDQLLNDGTPIFTAKATFKIVAEDSSPIEGAAVHVAVWNHSQYKDQTNDFRGQSDKDGLFIVESNCQGGFEITVAKSGHYQSNYFHQPCDWSTTPKDKEKLQPWNPTVPIMLKKIGKPIPMIVRLDPPSHRAPKLGEEVGFDLLKGDWLNPDGKGEIADLLIRFESEFLSPESYKTDATIRFANPDDGLLPITELIGEESELKYPRLAPENGYEVKSLNVKSPIYEARSEAKEKQPLGYLFRIRTDRDEVTNKITSAQYGKIVGRQGAQENTNPFQFNTLNRNEKRELVLEPSFTFSSYLNPTPNDQNLEYDQQNNLAPDANKGVTLPP